MGVTIAQASSRLNVADLRRLNQNPAGVHMLFAPPEGVAPSYWWRCMAQLGGFPRNRHPHWIGEPWREGMASTCFTCGNPTHSFRGWVIPDCKQWNPRSLTPIPWRHVRCVPIHELRSMQ